MRDFSAQTECRSMDAPVSGSFMPGWCVPSGKKRGKA